MGTEAVWIPAVLAAVGAGASYYNTEQTAKKQDNALADQISSQSRKQQDADAAVNKQVRDLEASTSADERAQRLQQYLDVVGKNRSTLQAGLTPGVGSDRFRQEAQSTAAAAEGYTGKMADLMARIDAGDLQRQHEGFAYGRLGTDLSLIGREAAGLSFIDQLRQSRIGRNPWLDAASAGLSGAASASASGSGSGVAAGRNATGGSAYAPYANGYRTGYGVVLPTYP